MIATVQLPGWVTCITGKMWSYFPLMLPQGKDLSVLTGEQAESLCRRWLHISTVQKDADFYNSSPAPFPQVLWCENTSFLLVLRRHYTKDAPQSVCIFCVSILIGFLWKFRLTLRGSLDVAQHPTTACLCLSVTPLYRSEFLEASVPSCLNISWGFFIQKKSIGGPQEIRLRISCSCLESERLESTW